MNTRANKVINVNLDVKHGLTKTVSNAYYKHAVQYGDYLDLRIYREVQYRHYGTDTIKIRGSQGDRRYDSLARSKVALYRLTMANVGKHGRYKPIFATYTFKEPITDLDRAVILFKSYIRRLSNELGFRPEYVAVPQIQWQRFEETGLKVWHFHAIFFNTPPISYKKNFQLWGQGRTDLQFVRGIRNVGAYIAGYFNKSDFCEVPFGRRFYYASRGLIRPIEFFHSDTIDSIISTGSVKVLSVFEGNRYTQLKYKL